MIKKRGGVWYSNFYVELPNGEQKRVRQSLKTADRALALVKAQELHSRMMRSGMAHKMTFGEAVERAWDNRWSHLPSARTMRTNINTVLSLVGDETYVEAIDNAEILRVRDLLLKECGQATVNRKMSAFRVVMEMCAKDWRVIDTLPAFPRTLRESSGRKRIVSPQEFQQLLNFTPSYRPELRTFWLFLLDTGCRRGEALQLTWADITWKYQEVQLRETKNGEPRTVPLSDRVTNNLRRLQPLFPRKPFDFTAATVRYAWTNARRAMGLEGDPEFVTHALRHTCATDLLEAGVDIIHVQGWLGHKTIEMTARYAKSRSGHLRQIRDRLGK